MYDRYVSLGRNCETGFQINRYLQRKTSGFFQWNVTSFSSLISLLEGQFAGILHSENLSLHGNGGLINDSSHNFKLHHNFDRTLFKEDLLFDQKLDQLRSKFDHFIDSFVDGAKIGRTAYFYVTADENDVRSNARVVRDILKDYHAKSHFDLVVVQAKAFSEPDWDDAFMWNRYVERLAPIQNASDGHVETWDEIFREFPHIYMAASKS